MFAISNFSAYFTYFSYFFVHSNTKLFFSGIPAFLCYTEQKGGIRYETNTGLSKL